MANNYAVMGHPVNHSLSPIIHQLFAQQTDCTLTYDKIQIDLPHFEQQVLSFFKSGGKGLNITLPCKQRAYALANKSTQRCQKAGAANTLWSDGAKLHADNTDGVGLLRDLEHYIRVAGKRILLLGAGGAARGVLAPLLQEKPVQLILVNRTSEKAHTLSREFVPAISCGHAELTGTFDLIINATSASLANLPLGTEDNSPLGIRRQQRLELPSTIFSSSTIFYDLTYRILAETPFVTWARQQGCVAIDGLGMLVEQAAEAFFIWHGIMPQTAPVLAHLRNNPFF